MIRSCLPVVEGSRLVGIPTESDFVRYLAEHVADEPPVPRKAGS